MWRTKKTSENMYIHKRAVGGDRTKARDLEVFPDRAPILQHRFILKDPKQDKASHSFRNGWIIRVSCMLVGTEQMWESANLHQRFDRTH